MPVHVPYDFRALLEAGFYSERELADRWHHSLRTIQRWRAEGGMPPFLRIGRRILYRRADVEAFEAEHVFGGEVAE